MPNQTVEEYLSKGGLIKVIEEQKKRNAWTKRKRKPKLINTIYINEDILKRFTCQLCTYRINCKAICPPIEWMVRQVEYEPPLESPLEHEPQNTKTPAQFSTKAATIDWPTSESTGVTIIKKYFTEHKTAKQIAKELNISIQYAYREIKKYKALIISKAHKSV